MLFIDILVCAVLLGFLFLFNMDVWAGPHIFFETFFPCYLNCFNVMEATVNDTSALLKYCTDWTLMKFTRFGVSSPSSKLHSTREILFLIFVQPSPDCFNLKLTRLSVYWSSS